MATTLENTNGVPAKDAVLNHALVQDSTPPSASVRDQRDTIQIALYENERDNIPKIAILPWPKLAENLTKHRRGAKSGAAWSPVRIDGPRAAKNVRAITAVVIDIDHADPDAAWLDRVIDRGLAGVLHSTHSHTTEAPSLRLVMRASREILPGEWPTVLASVIDEFDLPADPACKDLSRLYFAPAAPEGAEVVAEVLPGDRAVDVDAIVSEASRAAPKVAPTEPRVVVPAEVVGEDARSRAVAKLIAAKPERGLHLISRRLSGALAIGGWDADRIEAFVTDVLGVATDNADKRGKHARRAVERVGKGERVEGWPSLVTNGHYSATVIAEVRVLLGMPDLAAGAPEILEMLEVAKRGAAVSASADEFVEMSDERGELDLGKDERPRATASNLRCALRKLRVRVAFDEMSERKMIRIGERTVPLQDHHCAWLRVAVDQNYDLTIGRDLLADVLEVEARENAYHPVREFLAALTWDGVPRLDRWLIDFAGAADTEYVRAVSRIVLVAAVRRVRSPGCQFDEMLVLEGDQGAGKSSVWRTMAVSESWFTDSLVLDGGDPRRAIEATAGRWICEVAELGGLSRGAIDEIKAYLSRREDSARLAYARETSIRPRSFVVVGTTNDAQYLNDPTGARRFWPVKVGTIDLVGLAAVRDQLWAEACAAEAAGESIRLDPALYGAATIEQEARRVVDPWEDLLAERFRGRMFDRDGDRDWISTPKLYELLGVASDRQTSQTSRKLAAAMRALGWHPDRQKSGARLRGYARPRAS